MTRTILMLLALLLFGACAAAEPPRAGPTVLIFSHSTGFRHDSIGPGKAALAELVRGKGMNVVLSEDPALFSDDGLRRFDAIILLSNTTKRGQADTEWLQGERGAAFQRWYRRQGAVVGLHAASDSHYGWDWYGAMMGSRFKRHPAGTPTATLSAVPGWGLPASWSQPDEWYQLVDVVPGVTLLATLDPASIGEPAGAPWPVSYSHIFEGHRVFYTSLGHRPETYEDPRFLEHVSKGLDWVLKR